MFVHCAENISSLVAVEFEAGTVGDMDMAFVLNFDWFIRVYGNPIDGNLDEEQKYCKV